MEKEKLENKDLDKGKFSLVSRIYSNEFRTVTFVILNSKTGELRKEIINNEVIAEEAKEEAIEDQTEGEILAEVAKKMKDGINNLLSACNPKVEGKTLNDSLGNIGIRAKPLSRTA